MYWSKQIVPSVETGNWMDFSLQRRNCYVLPPSFSSCHLAVVNTVRCGLCGLEENFIVTFLYFLQFWFSFSSCTLCYNLLHVYFQTTRLRYHVVIFWKWHVRWKRFPDLDLHNSNEVMKWWITIFWVISSHQRAQRKSVCSCVQWKLLINGFYRSSKVSQPILCSLWQRTDEGRNDSSKIEKYFMWNLKSKGTI